MEKEQSNNRNDSEKPNDVLNDEKEKD